MSALGEVMTSGSERLVAELRGEYLELPGLSLTAAQAARVLDIEAGRSQRLLKRLVDAGFLVRDARGAYRRRDVSELAGRAAGWTREFQERQTRVTPSGARPADPPSPHAAQG